MRRQSQLLKHLALKQEINNNDIEKHQYCHERNGLLGNSLDLKDNLENALYKSLNQQKIISLRTDGWLLLTLGSVTIRLLRSDE